MPPRSPILIVLGEKHTLQCFWLCKFLHAANTDSHKLLAHYQTQVQTNLVESDPLRCYKSKYVLHKIPAYICHFAQLGWNWKSAFTASLWAKWNALSVLAALEIEDSARRFVHTSLSWWKQVCTKGIHGLICVAQLIWNACCYCQCKHNF